MVYRELDEFIIRLEQAGELIHVSKPVSPKLEITAIVERLANLPDKHNKALVFEHVEGSDFPVVVNLFGTARRMAWALGVDDLDALRERLSRLTDLQIPSTFSGMMSRAGEMLGMLRSISPELVEAKSAPVQDVVIRENPDVRIFPALKFWPGDNNSSLTLASTIILDPQTGEREVSMCRVEVFDGQTLGLHWDEYSHLAPNPETDNPKIPAAVVLGGDPAEMWCGSMRLPSRLDAYMLAGWLRGKSVKLARCVSQELDVPADAEIAIEGWIDPDERRTGGPFGEMTGYYSQPNPVAVLHVTAITHREKAMLPVMIPSRQSREAIWMHKVRERLLLPVTRLLLDEIADLHVSTVGIPDGLVIVSIRKDFPGQAQKVMYAVWGSGPLMLAKTVIVVDDDINVQDAEAVAKRVLETVDWSRDVIIVNGPAHPLDFANQDGLGGKIGVDATRKPDRQSQTDYSPIKAEAVNLIAGDNWATWGNGLLMIAPDKTTHNVKNTLFDLWHVCPDYSIVALDYETDVHDLSGAVWQVLTHVDWSRDVVFNNSDSRGQIGIDATTKDADDGYAGDWPDKTEMPSAITALVADKWSTYRIR